MKYLKLYESHFVGYTPNEKKLIISEVEDLIIDILELNSLDDYSIRFVSTILSEMTGEIKISLLFSRSSINSIISSNLYRLTQILSDRYSFKFDASLYNNKGGIYNDKGGIHNPLVQIDRKYVLDILNDDRNKIYYLDIHMKDNHIEYDCIKGKFFRT